MGLRARKRWQKDLHTRVCADRNKVQSTGPHPVACFGFGKGLRGFEVTSSVWGVGPKSDSDLAGNLSGIVLLCGSFSQGAGALFLRSALAKALNPKLQTNPKKRNGESQH